MSIIYFDICSIPLFLLILFVCYSRKMIKGAANQLFIVLVLLSLLSSIADLGMEIMHNLSLENPLTDGGIIICTVFTYAYMIFRNATNVVLLLLLLVLTRTTFLIKRTWAKIAFFLPYASILVMLIQNPFTHNVFTITETGYGRASLVYVFYGIALVYGLVGLVYCIYCFRYLKFNQWVALMTIYVLGHTAVLIQFFKPELLLEMFSTAISEMFIMLVIMRPEERMDREVGTLSYSSYQEDIRNIILSKEKVQIIVLRMLNGREIRNYLGDHRYHKYISGIANVIRMLHWKHPHHISVYYEKPGTIYLIVDPEEPYLNDFLNNLTNKVNEQMKEFIDLGVRFLPQICFISCPEDVRKIDEVINLGHKFHYLDNNNQNVYYAKDIAKSRSFIIESNIEKILDLAIKNHHIEMYYQPIYDTKSDSFHAAEALARLVSPEYGLLPPGVFIPAAENLGFIIGIGDLVLEETFRFVSEHDLDALGISYIEVNLSVAQCVESTLPDKILALQNKYGVNPKYINLEITETTFENISEIMVENINKLIEMGYSFSLDDYGIGYSSVQRVSTIPFTLIKIDKSIVDECATTNGKMILEHTIKMMHSIGKKLVCEGAESIETVDILKDMDCDYIQGFYFSKPIPEKDFIKFLKDNKRS